MKQCKQCLFYDEAFDQLMQGGDDILIVGEEKEYKEKHFCRFYADKNGIDDKILKDIQKCENRIQKSI